VGAIALVGATAAAALFVGSRPSLPDVSVVAYEAGGDIFAGNPATGETQLVTSGSAVDTSPVLSPDGRHIAFIRDSAPIWDDNGLYVVDADGSDLHMVRRPGDAERGHEQFAWTPDGRWLFVVHDGSPNRTPYWDGIPSLVDAAGVEEPRLLTPPLPVWPGGPYFNATSGVAPMFQPPTGDLIVSGGWGALNLFDSNLDARGQIGREALEPYEPYAVMGESWSPDGSQILFELRMTEGGLLVGSHGLFLINGDGTALRKISDGPSGGAWSPDGSRIAEQLFDTEGPGMGSAIVIVDAASLERRRLDATLVSTKTEGDVSNNPNFRYESGPAGRTWDYEGWSWTPDGRGIVWLETRGERPKVIDIASGVVTELPWAVDSPISWRSINAADYQ
jgi:hypothetical protein